MLADLKYTLKHSAIYGLSRIGTKLISFILIPLYTSVFVSDTIANINLLESFWQYLFTICMFAFETAIINICASETDLSKRERILFNFFFLSVINSSVIIFCGAVFSGSLSSLILKESGYGSVIFYCFLISAFESLLIMPMTLARLNDRPVLYTVITLSNLLINLLLQIYFILIQKLEFNYIFLAKFIAPAVLFLAFLPYVLRYLKFNISLKEIKVILSFSFPLMLAMLLSMLLNSVDRFILVDFVSKHDVAVYTLGYSIGSITNAMILSPFTLAINVIFWKKINDDNFRRFMTKSSTYLFAGMIFCSLLISLFINYAVMIFVRNSSLWDCVSIVPFILFSNCFTALLIFPSLDFYYHKKTGMIMLITAISLVFSIVINFTFIRYGGIFASAIIAVLSSILMISLNRKLSKDISFTKFEFMKIVLLSVLYIIFTGFLFIVKIDNAVFDIILKTAMIFLFVYLLYILKFFETIELQSISGFFNKYFRRR